MLDLNEVTLVDVAGLHFLIACEVEGIELVHCPPYIREWMGTDAGPRGVRVFIIHCHFVEIPL